MRPLAVLTHFIAASGLAACTAPGGPSAVTSPDFEPTDAGPDAVPAAPLRCVPARGQPLPARVTAMSAEAPAAKDTTMFTADLFGLFKSHCGACHVEAKLGNFQATVRTFSKEVDQKTIDAIRSNEPAKLMPPLAAGGKPFRDRAPDDPVVGLASLLEHWLAQGRPSDAFAIPSEKRAGTYVMSEAVGRGMTNLGDCVAEPGAQGGGDPRKMDDLDAFFAKAAVLPASLHETDLSTLDGAELAQSRVIAFAPAYPLWSDDAAKIRHIRVPRGQSVKFDKQAQKFDIPANTRFYKTFLKEVVDRSGRRAYRKIETRLIVARPDHRRADGTFEIAALFGTYVWNEEETAATLLRDPLRNGQPFRDRVLTYAAHEPKVQAVMDSKPPNLSFALEEENKGLLRRYAIPSAERCVQCHMGSPGGSFVLGFIPLQIARRRPGAGGVSEPAAEHELDQLMRLVGYGVITGLSSAEDVLPLERSQGGRQPRNDHELEAQGYLLGNCAGCHNPRGFPSAKSPDLKDVLDFLPSATGGIFQFPLERVSPLRKRGAEQDIPMPYITPSLREYPAGARTTHNWTPKWADCSSGSWVVCAKRSNGLGSGSMVHVDAPWRSLVYRNVDTPFSYADDFVVFPRMPMHAPGFDCRAPRIIGDWMVSIPAVRKNPSVPEDAIPGNRHPVDTSPQPYEEVKPGDARYAEALAAAQDRLAKYHAGGRYGFCADGAEGADILDPAVVRGARAVPSTEEVFDPSDPTKTAVVMPPIGVPTRPHWVVTDLTDTPGEWFPRRVDWHKTLVDGTVDVSSLPAADRLPQGLLAGLLPEVRLTKEVRDFASTETPFGLWERKPACDFGGEPKVSDFPRDQRPRWMNSASLAPDAPVYMQSPGAAIFGAICVNCHGPKADSKGLLAEAIMNMTGGDARVANFRDGLFGPADHPGANRERVFGAAADDLAARYTAWMALGGTQRVLPAALLNIVGATRVLGETRQRIVPEGTPNMLQLASELCGHLLPAAGNINDAVVDSEFFSIGTFDLKHTGVIEKNADGEMWQRLCNMGNRMVVRVPHVDKWDEGTGGKSLRIEATRSLYWADAYPPDAEVLDHRGRIVRGVRPENFFPVCFRRPGNAVELALADKYLQARPIGGPGGPIIPYCPKELFEPDPKRWLLKSEFDHESSRSTLVDVVRWKLRGAVNAGLAVFVYLDQLQRGLVKPKPAFNKCEELKK